MHYKVEQFEYNPVTKVYSQEASTLQTNQVFGVLRSGTHGITIRQDEWTVEFLFTGADNDHSGEDIAVWNFSPTMDAVRKHPILAGTSVVIFND